MKNKILAIALCLTMVLTTGSFAFAAEDASTPSSEAAPEVFVFDEETTDEAAESTTEPATTELVVEEESAEPETEPVVEEATEDAILSLYDQLMAAETIEDLCSVMLDADKADREALTKNEIKSIFELVDKLDPSGATSEAEQIVEILLELPNFISGAEEDGEEAAKDAFDGKYIYFDLYYGDVKITESGYSGYIGKDNTAGTPEAVTGTHKNTNKYYIFQSKGEKYSTSSTGKIPQYSRPTVNGTSWGNYITNHPSKSSAGDDSVDELITAWNTANASKRVATGNSIEVKTTKSNTTFNVTIDDIWSSKAQNGNEGDDTGLSFKSIGTKNVEGSYSAHTYSDCATNVTFNLTAKGDNRFGRLHAATHDGQNRKYRSDKNHTNTLNITGDTDATLTLANLEVDKSTAYTGALIGGTDAKDHSLKTSLDKITIYAGGGRYDFGTAIGGGGNGDGRVTINGGRVTAVNSATGTAIGGGCGTNGPGGYGNVTVTGGEVYAYNYRPHFTSEGSTSYTDAMPTAIGGGSSGIREGGTGIVNIYGDDTYVYAYSEVGNAIGGGGGGNGFREDVYYSTYGGTADVAISGKATVEAVSGTGCAIGGGPGGGRLYSGGIPSGVNSDGGTAKLTISGSPTVRSGSIGGGSPLEQNRTYGATVGAAVVKISGGTIHGQVVMDGVIKNVSDGIDLTEGDSSSFTMTGGLIDNTFIDNKYFFVEDNGGAVYINSGDATISGGTIQDCESPKGGAIYVKGGNFTLSGKGRITNAKAIGDGSAGGAVYVDGGNVFISGGEISNVTAPKGGAAYVTNGNLNMSGGMITNAITDTNGGAVYVNGGNYLMTSGTIKDCEAKNDGGAVYVNSQGGNSSVIFGVKDCAGTGDKHSVEPTSLAHPVLTNNTALNGGAVAVTKGTPIMYCGDFNSNTATENGGSVYVANGSFTMNNGSISGGTLPENVTNNAELGGAVYVSGGDFNMNGGKMSGNKAPKGGAVYVSGGNFNMKGGTVSGNTALNGGAAYIIGGNFTMISGEMKQNTAYATSPEAAEAGTEGYGGAVYAAKSGETGGTIIVGIQGCSGEGTVHTVTHTGLAHPLVSENTAEFGGGFAVNGGSVAFYCGTVNENITGSDGTGKNVFMKDGTIVHYLNETHIGSDTNHGMVSTGGELTVQYKEGEETKYFKVELIYNANIENPDDAYIETIWKGEAPNDYYLNLPYCPTEWQEWQSKEEQGNLTFVGWSEAPVTLTPEVVRSTRDYNPIGTAVKINDTIAGDDQKTMRFYAVWAPATSDIDYRYVLNDTADTEIMDYTEYVGPESYKYFTTPETIQVGAPDRDGFTFEGWILYASPETISNWDADPYKDAEGNPYDRLNNIYNKHPKLKGQLVKIVNEDEGTVEVPFAYLEKDTLSTLQNFGDITLVAVFTPAYADLAITKASFVNETTPFVDPDQTFMFQITGKPDNDALADVDLTVTVNGSGTAIVKELPVGNYEVKELTQWSWRYDCMSDVSQQVIIDDPQEKYGVEFKNNYVRPLWLTDCDYEWNLFGTPAAGTLQ